MNTPSAQEHAEKTGDQLRLLLCAHLIHRLLIGLLERRLRVSLLLEGRLLISLLLITGLLIARLLISLLLIGLLLIRLLLSIDIFSFHTVGRSLRFDRSSA